MGYICHHAILVTAFGDKVDKAQEKAKEIVGEEVVSEVCHSPINGYRTFLVFPDGSKEGWKESDNYEVKREQFMEWLKEDGYYDWALIQYGDEERQDLLLQGSASYANSF